MKIWIKFLSVYLSLATILTFNFTAQAADLSVATSIEFQNALTLAATNDQEDTITLTNGTYPINGSTFEYLPDANESFSLTIQGAGPEATILDGSDIDQVLFIDTNAPLLLDDTGVTITLTNLSIINGRNGGDGGGVEMNLDRANVVINTTRFINNSATGDDGGALDIDSNFASSISLERVLFENNAAADSGGAVRINSDGTISIVNCIFNSNHADANESGGGDGGAVALFNNGNHGDFDFINNTVFGNRAANFGGALYLILIDNDVASNFYNNIFYENEISTPLSAISDIYIDNGMNEPVINFANNIFSGLTGVAMECFNCTATTSSENFPEENPLFVDAAGGDFNLQANSPAIDTGNNLAPDLPTLDYLGNTRIMGPVVAAIVDRGAIEFIASPPPTPENTDDELDDNPQANPLDNTSIGGSGCTLGANPTSSSTTLPAAFALLLALAASWRFRSSKQA